jgi:HEAT repeats
MEEPIHGRGASGMPDPSGLPSPDPRVNERAVPRHEPAPAVWRGGKTESPDSEPAAGTEDVACKAAAGWLHQFERTLKTCRLYDAANPTVQRFRDELVHALERLVAEHGAVTYRFDDEDVRCGDQVVHTARSREDNLAFVFHRDGVRGLTFQPGVTAEECLALVDAVLAVTGQNLDGDDLVTLLWEAHLRHLEVDYIPAEGDAGAEASATTPDDGAGPLLPWPTASENDAARASAPASGADDTRVRGERSEDWAIGETTDEVEATFVELDTLAPSETRRFLAEFEAERRVPPATAALAIVYACLHTDATADDRREMVAFLPRVLRAALAAGAWSEAREALRLLRATATGDWSEEAFLQEILQPVGVTRVVERLDQQGPAAIADYLALAQELGAPAVDWLTLVLSESQARLTRQLVAEAIAAQVQRDPARMAAWLSDPRWYVVRNVVHILGWVGGPAVVPLLQTAVRHADPRVVAEVVNALQGIELRLARPVLIKALEHADAHTFGQALHQLSAARDPAVARFVTAFLAQERFLQRPAEERRAIYAAIASTGGDEVVADLEAALNAGNWFDREMEVHRHAVARCLSRIGTPRALAVLQAGAQSHRAPVRQACATALQTRHAA